MGPRAGEHEGQMGPRAGEHEGHMGPRLVGPLQAWAPVLPIGAAVSPLSTRMHASMRACMHARTPFPIGAAVAPIGAAAFAAAALTRPPLLVIVLTVGAISLAISLAISP